MILSRPPVLRSSLSRHLLKSSNKNLQVNAQLGRRILQRNARRNYASKSEHETSQLKSDLPWLVSAVAVTVPGTYYLLQPRHADHGDHDDHHDEHAEEHTGKGEDIEEESSDVTEESQSDNDDETDSGEGEQQHEDTNNAPASPNSTESDDAKAKGGERNISFQAQSGKDDLKRHEGQETAGGLPHGFKESENEGESGSGKDKAAASKESLSQNQMSGKQAGLSNTPTKHSLDPTKDPQNSKKAEGAPETAKLQGTVKSDRLLSDNKEKFGSDRI